MKQEPKRTTDFPLMCEIEEGEPRHEHVRALIKRAIEIACHHPKDLFTLTQVASRLNISVGELRDDARTWKDTEVRVQRLITRLKSRLHDSVLKWDNNAARAQAALSILQLEMKEGQLSSDNRVMIEGTGRPVLILNYAEFEDGKPIKSGDQVRKDYSYQATQKRAARREAGKDPDGVH